FQDVDEQQYRLNTQLAPEGESLCVIGDPNQAIYGFRGADASCFARLRRDYPTAKTVSLTRNYRSTGTIVAASALLMGNASDRALTDVVHALHERITIETAPTDRSEAESVVKTIERIIGGSSFFAIDSGRTGSAAGQNFSFADFAVLYRTDAQSAVLSEALFRSGIPYKKSSQAPLTDAPAVRALLAALDDSPGSDAGHLSLALRLRVAAEELEARGEAEAFDSTAIQSALSRLSELASSCGEDRARLLDAVALASETDFWDPRADRVSLLTLHAAKGLEFPVVFIVGLEDGILPLRFGEPDDDALAEERRLFYVGMTRAKDRLILSRARKRNWRGRVREFAASPFLSDIETELLKHRQPQLPRRNPEDRQLSLL